MITVQLTAETQRTQIRKLLKLRKNFIGDYLLQKLSLAHEQNYKVFRPACAMQPDRKFHSLLSKK